MKEFAEALLRPGQEFEPALAVDWFRKKYGRIRPTTVRMHVEGMSINSTLRVHHPSIKPGSGHDLFFKVAPGRYRLWDPKTDGQPIYRPDILSTRLGVSTPATLPASADNENEDEGDEDLLDTPASREFAQESDLRDYLASNLTALEKGLALYIENGVSGIEFAVGADGALVVVELKVSRGYERTLGQIARYMAYVKKNMAGDKKVRGIIVASGITDDLKLAASMIPDVRLVEYEISFKLKPVEPA